METNHTNSQPAAAEHQPEIRLPNGTTTKGVLLHRGMANLQHDADHADFEPQTKVYLAWMNDLNGNRFGLKITDANDQLLLRQTEFLDDAIKELAYADAPANAELTPDDYKPAQKILCTICGPHRAGGGFAMDRTSQAGRCGCVQYAPSRLDVLSAAASANVYPTMGAAATPELAIGFSVSYCHQA